MSFDATQNLQIVIFVSELYQDIGEPLLKMFTLLIHHITSHGFFEGRRDVHYTSRLNSMDYYVNGKMIATALVHGDHAPHCCSASFFEYLVYEKMQTPDSTRQEKLCKIIMLLCL